MAPRGQSPSTDLAQGAGNVDRPMRSAIPYRPPMTLDQLLDAFDEVEGADGVRVLEQLRAAHDRVSGATTCRRSATSTWH